MELKAMFSDEDPAQPPPLAPGGDSISGWTNVTAAMAPPAAGAGHPLAPPKPSRAPSATEARVGPLGATPKAAGPTPTPT
eukprot:8012470-Pyramimonas_sp.AAC.1